MSQVYYSLARWDTAGIEDNPTPRIDRVQVARVEAIELEPSLRIPGRR